MGLRADALVSLLVGVLILPRAVLILRDAGAVLMESTPKGLDLHASQISTGLPMLSAHIVVESCFRDEHLPDCWATCRAASPNFPVSIEHPTFQFEPLNHQTQEPARHA